MAGGNDKRKNSWLDDQPYYMQSQQVMRRRDWDTREKYKNENMDRKNIESKQTKKEPVDMRESKNRNREYLKAEGQDRAESAKQRRQKQIADNLLKKKNFNERLNKVKEQGDSAEKQGKLIPRELRHIQDYDYSQDNWDSGKLMDHKTRQGQNYQKNYLKNDANYKLESSKRRNKK